MLFSGNIVKDHAIVHDSSPKGQEPISVHTNLNRLDCLNTPNIKYILEVMNTTKEKAMDILTAAFGNDIPDNEETVSACLLQYHNCPTARSIDSVKESEKEDETSRSPKEASLVPPSPEDITAFFQVR